MEQPRITNDEQYVRVYHEYTELNNLDKKDKEQQVHCLSLFKSLNDYVKKRVKKIG